MPVTLEPISNAAITVRWKEPYASDALNRKFSVIVPAGVYRGLKLEVSASDLSVDVAEDPTHTDHVGVFETEDGYSITYRDRTSGRLTFDLSSFLSGETVIIAVSAGYSVGVDTTAEFQGYTQAEFDALTAAQRGGIVVLGTVLRSASGVIPAANINHDERDISFLNRASESVPWNPLLRNGGFEASDTSETFAHASPFWETSNTPTSGGAVFLSSATDVESNSGSKSLEISASVAGGVISTAKQVLYTSVTPGRSIRVSLYKKAIQAATGTNSGILRLSFEDKDGGSDTNVDLNFDVDSADGSFVELSGVVIVPAGMAVLKTAEVIVTGTYAGTGACIRIDDVQVWYEVDAEEWLSMNSSLSSEVNTDSLIVGNRPLGIDAAKVSFDGEDLVVESRDPAATPAGLNVSRIIAVPSVAAGIEYTLVWESDPGNLGNKSYRKYISPDGHLVETVNAWWDNDTNLWTKDSSGSEATRRNQTHTGFNTRTMDTGTNTWADSAWINPIQTLIIPTVSMTFLQLDASGSAFDGAMENGWLRGTGVILVGYAPVSPYLKPGDTILTAESYIDSSGGEVFGVELQEAPHGNGFTGTGVSDEVQASVSGVIAVTNIDFNSSTNIIDADTAYWLKIRSINAVNSSNAIYSSKVTYQAG